MEASSTCEPKDLGVGNDDAESLVDLECSQERKGQLCLLLERVLAQHEERLISSLDGLLTSRLAEQRHGFADILSVCARASSCGDAGSVEQVCSLDQEHTGSVSRKASSTPVGRKPQNAFATRQSFGTSQVEKKKSAKEVRFARQLSPGSALKLAQRTRFSLRRKLNDWVDTPSFELTSCWLIISNAIFLGVEAQVNSSWPGGEAQHRFFWVVGQVFTLVFTLEILLRVCVDVRGFFCSQKNWHWNYFDGTIVLAGLVEMVLSMAGRETKTSLTHVRIIRVARTVRVFKVVRLLSIFTSLRILVNSVLNTLRSLLWTLVLLIVILYLFGLLFTNATLEYVKDGTGDSATAQVLQLSFGSLFRSIYTLFQAITNGVGWSEVASPLGRVHALWEAIFSLFVMFIYFAVLNVVTGVFCQSAIESASQDRDTLVQQQLAMQRVYTEQLQHIFSQIDEDSTGNITLNMLEESLQDDQVKAYFDGLDLTTDDAWNLFKLLDTNESNSIDLGEFVAGCLRLRGRARSIDIHMLMYQSQWTMKRLGDVLEKLGAGESCPGSPNSGFLQALGMMGRHLSVGHRSSNPRVLGRATL